MISRLTGGAPSFFRSTLCVQIKSFQYCVILPLIIMTILQGITSMAGVVEVQLVGQHRFFSNGKVIVYLTENPTGSLTKGYRMPLDDSLKAIFTDVPEGIYFLTIDAPEPSNLELFRDPDPVSVSSTNQHQIVEIEHTVFTDIFLPPNVCIRRKWSARYDGALAPDYLCNHVKHIDTGSCCGLDLIPATPVLTTNVTNYSALWSTGDTNLITQLPHGTSTLTITDHDTGCISSNSVYVSSNTLAETLGREQFSIISYTFGYCSNFYFDIETVGIFGPAISQIQVIDSSTGQSIPFEIETVKIERPPIFHRPTYRVKGLPNTPSGSYEVLIPVSGHTCNVERHTSFTTTIVEDLLFPVPLPAVGGSKTITTRGNNCGKMLPEWLTVSETATTNDQFISTLTASPWDGIDPRRSLFRIGVTDGEVIQLGSRQPKLELSFSRYPVLTVVSEFNIPVHLEFSHHPNGPWQKSELLVHDGFRYARNWSEEFGPKFFLRLARE